MTGTDDRRARLGLCATCRRARPVRSSRGSEFVLCERSREDPRWERYPRVPRLECEGYEPLPTGDAGS